MEERGSVHVFIWPLVGKTEKAIGVNAIQVPMPFDRSVLITTDINLHFYHVTYHRFPVYVAPDTFDLD